MDAPTWRTFKHAATLFDPKSKNIQLHRTFARNSNFYSQVTIYDSPRFQRLHTRLIWTCLLGGHSNTRIHFLTQNPKTFNYTGCVHAIQTLIARCPSMMVHDSNDTTLALYGRVCLEDIQSRGDSFWPKIQKHSTTQDVCTQFKFNGQVNLNDGSRFQRHHTRLIWTCPLGGHSLTRGHFLT